MGAVFAAAAIFGYGTPGSAKLPFRTARDKVFSESTVQTAALEVGDPHPEH
jgi:hypothetical protein